jgi:hypothetical protein
VFSLGQIVVCAVAGAVVSGLVVIGHARRSGERADAVLAAGVTVVAGVTILLWRSAANVAALNDDAIPWVSPNDLLSPVVTYAALGAYAGLAGVSRRTEWPAIHGLVTLAVLVVNVLTI